MLLGMTVDLWCWECVGRDIWFSLVDCHIKLEWHSLRFTNMLVAYSVHLMMMHQVSLTPETYNLGGGQTFESLLPLITFSELVVAAVTWYLVFLPFISLFVIWIFRGKSLRKQPLIFI